jgi:hypothetical protein
VAAQPLERLYENVSIDAKRRRNLLSANGLLEMRIDPFFGTLDMRLAEIAADVLGGGISLDKSLDEEPSSTQLDLLKGCAAIAAAFDTHVPALAFQLKPALSQKSRVNGWGVALSAFAMLMARVVTRTRTKVTSFDPRSFHAFVHQTIGETRMFRLHSAHVGNSHYTRLATVEEPCPKYWP